MEKQFKIRRADGQFYVGPLWRPVWNQTGKIFKTLKGAQEIANDFLSFHKIPKQEFTIVEYTVTETATHKP